MIGDTINHYKILEKLGEGGMGVVYKAHDIKLDRVVALKFLPAESTADQEDRTRFMQEARAAAKLSHPNICGIHSIGEYEDRRFIDMEFVEGQTLRKKMRQGDLSLETVIDYALQIADALGEAHSRDIIHRDIKPENIMVDRKGNIKIMDFGLAKLKGMQNITKAGSTVGTTAYMSPEQIQGGDIDRRADIFSFGVVLYDMLAGRKPFPGEHEAAMMYAIVNEEPVPLERHLPEAPTDLLHIIERVLEKDPGDRYRSADDLGTELKRLKRKSDSQSISIGSSSAEPPAGQTASSGTEQPEPPAASGGSTSVTINIPDFSNRSGLVAAAVVLIAAVLAGYWFFTSQSAPASEDRSIAVLPLENLNSGQDEAYFTEGIHDDIIVQLSKIEDMKVIARSSVLRYPPGDRDLQEVGEELGVSAVLEGNIRRADSTVRVSVQMIDVDDLETLWAEVYERQLTDLFAIQGDIAREIADALRANVTQNEQEQIARYPTDNMQAYEHYLRGLDYRRRAGYREEDWKIAEQHFTRAIELDPDFAHAYARRSLNHAAMYWFAHDPDPERLERARQDAEKALELQPDLPQAQMAMGNYYYRKRNYKRALNYISDAREKMPNDSRLLSLQSYVQRRMGLWEQSTENLEKAVELDPFNTEASGQLGLSYLNMREYQKAEKWLDKTLEISPDDYNSRLARGYLYFAWKGDTGPVKKLIEEHADIRFNAGTNWFTAKFLLRDYRGLLQFAEEIEGDAVEGQISVMPTSYISGLAYHYLGEEERAREHLQQARGYLEERLEENPEDPRLHGSLGLTLALLDRPDEAIEQAERAMELMPVEEDALLGGDFVVRAAEIHAHAGEKDRAVELLERALEIPSNVSVEILKNNPTWDPLRDHPGFQELVD